MVYLLLSRHASLTRKRIHSPHAESDKRVRFMKPFGFLDYVKLQMSACAVLSDSGTITEELTLFTFGSNLRQVHQRPEGFEEGSGMIVGLDITLVCKPSIFWKPSHVARTVDSGGAG